MGNDNFDNIFSDDTGSSENTSQVDIKPVKLSRVATTCILVALALCVMILIITVKSCSLEKKVNNSQPTEPSKMVSEKVVESDENLGEDYEKNDENSSYFDEVESTSAENTTSVISGTPSTEIGNSTAGDGGELVEVVLPEFSNIKETTGIVVSKRSFTYKGSYVYGVSLSVLIGDTTETVQYFCPKKTYDALNSTDTITAEYQMDSDGNVSIVSISK